MKPKAEQKTGCFTVEAIGSRTLSSAMSVFCKWPLHTTEQASQWRHMLQDYFLFWVQFVPLHPESSLALKTVMSHTLPQSFLYVAPCSCCSCTVHNLSFLHMEENLSIYHHITPRVGIFQLWEKSIKPGLLKICLILAFHHIQEDEGSFSRGSHTPCTDSPRTVKPTDTDPLPQPSVESKDLGRQTLRL